MGDGGRREGGGGRRQEGTCILPPVAARFVCTKRHDLWPFWEAEGPPPLAPLPARLNAACMPDVHNVASSQAPPRPPTRRSDAADWDEGWDEDDGGEFSLQRAQTSAEADPAEESESSVSDAESEDTEGSVPSDADPQFASTSGISPRTAPLHRTPTPSLSVITSPIPRATGLSREERYQLRRQREEAHRQRQLEKRKQQRRVCFLPGPEFVPTN